MVPVPDYTSVPEELRNARIWLPFQTSPRASGGVNKIPHDVRGHRANYTNPDVWLTYPDAIEMLRGGRYQGIGLVVTKDMGYLLIDFDHCIIDGVLDPEVAGCILKLDTYTERSYSGDGLHGIAKGKLPWDKKKANRIEMYDDKRFFVVTGDHLAGTPRTIESRQKAVNAIHLAYFGPEPKSIPSLAVISTAEATGGSNTNEAPGLGDEDVIRVLRRLPVYDKYWRGWKGKGNNPSRADFALGCRLAVLTGNNKAQMYRLLMRSGLKRPEYSGKRGPTDYLGFTINKCIEATTDKRDGSAEALLRPVPVKYDPKITGPTEQPGQLNVTSFALNDINDVSGSHNIVSNNISRETETAPISRRKWQRRTASRDTIVSVLASYGWVKLSTINREANLKGRAAYHQLQRLTARNLVERKGDSYRMIRERKPRVLKPCTSKPIPHCFGTMEPRKTLSRSDVIRRGWPAQMIDDRLPEEGRHYRTETFSTPDNRTVTARYYWVKYILAAEREPAFEADRSRFLRPPREDAENAVVRFLIDSKGLTQSNYHIALRTGLDPRVVAAVVKELVKQQILVGYTAGHTRMFGMAYMEELEAA
jgi:putative DNA primase/helicase